LVCLLLSIPAASKSSPSDFGSPAAEQKVPRGVKAVDGSPLQNKDNDTVGDEARKQSLRE